MELFDKVYVVNLKHRTDRMSQFEEQARKINLSFSRFEGINGKECGIRPGEPPFQSWSTISLGNMGNVISQRNIIQDAKNNKYDSILILEDDVMFGSKPEIDNYLDMVPNDWDMIYFGGNHSEPLDKVDGFISRCRFTLTAHSVGIRSSMYNTILDITKDLNVPIDLSYAQLHKSHNVYCSNKNLTWQSAGYSDIEDREVDYEILRHDK